MTAKTPIQNLKLGIFVVLGTILLIIAAYLIGNGQSLFVKKFTVNAVFNNVNGLQVGNNVRFSGNLLYPLANGSKTISSTTILNLKIALLVFSKHSSTDEALEVVRIEIVKTVKTNFNFLINCIMAIYIILAYNLYIIA